MITPKNSSKKKISEMVTLLGHLAKHEPNETSKYISEMNQFFSIDDVKPITVEAKGIDHWGIALDSFTNFQWVTNLTHSNKIYNIQNTPFDLLQKTVVKGCNDVCYSPKYIPKPSFLANSVVHKNFISNTNLNEIAFRVSLNNEEAVKLVFNKNLNVTRFNYINNVIKNKINYILLIDEYGIKKVNFDENFLFNYIGKQKRWLFIWRYAFN